MPANLVRDCTTPVRDPAVGRWLWLLVGLIVIMVAVGGATRLTGSGLSITEWRPVTGAIPPLSADSWTTEFAKYRGSSQYANLNEGMSLADFQSIYWWEWGHRQLGRLIGLAFFLPLVAFWGTGRLSGRQALVLLGIGALGGLQAGVGWIMVASGLEPGMVAVAPLKLTLHLMIATLILTLLVWNAVDLETVEPAPAGTGTRGPAVLLALIILQIALGGLVAGSKAGLTYNTWPLMDGHIVPPADTLFAVRPWIENFVDNPALVQFNHRLVAYSLLAWACACAWIAGRHGPSRHASRARMLAGLVLLQAGLGVATLLLQVPLAAGLAHQAMAMMIVCVATRHLRLTTRPRRVAHLRLANGIGSLAPAGVLPR